jgi:hypothetical protein
MGNLILSDLMASSWGSSWEPDARDQRDWAQIEQWPPPEDSAGLSDDAPGDRPIFEPFGERRLVLIGR